MFNIKTMTKSQKAAKPKNNKTNFPLSKALISWYYKKINLICSLLFLLPNKNPEIEWNQKSIKIKKVLKVFYASHQKINANHHKYFFSEYKTFFLFCRGSGGRCEGVGGIDVSLLMFISEKHQQKFYWKSLNPFKCIMLFLFEFNGRAHIKMLPTNFSMVSI